MVVLDPNEWVEGALPNEALEILAKYKVPVFKFVKTSKNIFSVLVPLGFTVDPGLRTELLHWWRKRVDSQYTYHLSVDYGDIYSLPSPTVIREEKTGLEEGISHLSQQLFLPGFEPKPSDPVNHPSHYTFGKIEVIEALEDWGLNFHRANAVKYIARAGKKDPSKEIQDLEKAIWYLERDVKRLKTETEEKINHA